jgi:hypothetical protein
MFRAMGHADVAVLDGGFNAWREAGGAVEDLPPHFMADRHFTVRPRRDLVRASALTAAGVSPNAVLFEAQGRRIVVPASDLIATNQVARHVFLGETVCAAAIARLARAEQAVVYWLMGHGEGEVTDYDALTGFSTIAREIRHEGYDLRLLELWRTKSVPADAEALIVAGPALAAPVGKVTHLEGKADLTDPAGKFVGRLRTSKHLALAPFVVTL